MRTLRVKVFEDLNNRLISEKYMNEIKISSCIIFLY